MYYKFKLLNPKDVNEDLKRLCYEKSCKSYTFCEITKYF